MDVFSVFCIGTGHTKNERNNTMVALYDECRCERPNKEANYKFITDGPTGKNAMTGGGMIGAMNDAMEAIKGANPLPKRVNLAGHSRGAILCHMIAHALFKDPETTNIEITLALIDPVHQSYKKAHIRAGAEELADNPRMLAYQAIIMENENTGLLRGPDGQFYPFKFVNFENDDDANRVYYINMPGTHGSGTQVLTNPVAKVVKELIKNFMRKRGTTFTGLKKTPLEMCELFADIHGLNPFDRENNMRLIFNDKGKASEHKEENAAWRSTEMRAASVAVALQHNRTYVPHEMKKRNRIDTIGENYYFINEKHAKFFGKAFPGLWSGISGRRKIPQVTYEVEISQLKKWPGFHLLDELIKDRMPKAKVIPEWRI